MPSVLLASNNGHKCREFRDLLEPAGFAVLTPDDVGMNLTVEETGTTFTANAQLKCEGFSAVSGLVTLADDSGLSIDALGGEPGVLSARYGGPGLDDAGRSALVLRRLDGVPRLERTAHFTAALAVGFRGQTIEVIEESVEGVITSAPEGDGGFGYDPIFFYPPLGRTFAQLSIGQKASVSHRGRATRRLVETLARFRSAGIL